MRQAGDLALHKTVDIRHPAGQAQCGRGAMDERSEAHTLHGPLHPEAAYGHAGLLAASRVSCAISSVMAVTRGSTASATAGESPVPSVLSAPSTA